MSNNQLDEWKNYFILDSLLQGEEIMDRIWSDTYSLSYHLNSLKQLGYLNDDLQVTATGRQKRKELYKLLDLNPHTAHIYPLLDYILF